jgi:hypothetical protein
MHMTLTEEQACLISRALDLYSRLMAGQFWALISELRWHDVCNDDADYMIREAQKLMFPTGELSIHSAPKHVQLSYDMYKAIMHILAPHAPVHNEPHEPITGQKIEITK